MEYEIVIKPKSVFTLGIKELWQYRELLYFFTWKEIKVRYKQAFLGILWTLLQPVAMMLIFVMLLSKGLGLSTGDIPPPIYYLSGLLIWNLFNHAVSNASQSMVTHGNIIKKIYFPRLIIPISSVLTASFDFVISLILFISLALYYSISQSWDISWIFLLAGFFIAYVVTVFFAFSLGTFLSAINVQYRDVRYILPFLIQTLFFISPVMYDSSAIGHSWLNVILALNPLTFAIELIRNNISGNENFVIPQISLMVVLVMILLYVVAIYTFRKTEAYFADIV